MCRYYASTLLLRSFARRKRQSKTCTCPSLLGGGTSSYGRKGDLVHAGGTADTPQMCKDWMTLQLQDSPWCDGASPPQGLQRNELVLHRPAWWKLAHSSRKRSQDAVRNWPLLPSQRFLPVRSRRRCSLRAYRGLSGTLLVPKALRDKKAKPHFRNSHKPMAQNAIPKMQTASIRSASKGTGSNVSSGSSSCWLAAPTTCKKTDSMNTAQTG